MWGAHVHARKVQFERARGVHQKHSKAVGLGGAGGQPGGKVSFLKHLLERLKATVDMQPGRCFLDALTLTHNHTEEIAVFLESERKQLSGPPVAPGP